MAMRNLWILVCFLSCLAQFGRPSYGDTYQLTIAPRAQDAFGRATYRLWLPSPSRPIRAIIVRQHGCGPGARRLGLEHADDLQWQALAKKWDCALLGSQLWAPQEDCSTWTIPADGSDYAFLTALDRFAAVTGKEELRVVPWCLWGHSGGAMWVCNMTYTHPHRVVAAFPRSGGLSPLGRMYTRSRPFDADSRPQAFRVPIMFCHGADEYQEKSRFYKGIAGAYRAFNVGREHAAPWAIVSHPKSGHENANSRLLAIRYFDALLKIRLPQEGARLRPVEFQTGRMTTSNDHSRILPPQEETRTSPAWSWLPDIATAKAWVELSLTGNVMDTSAPPAPEQVRANRQGTELILSWNAEADVESGIAYFEIFQGEQKLGEVRGQVDRRWNPQGNFHAWNYSDQPLQGAALPAMRFVVKDKPQAKPEEFSVRTVNQAGLPSAAARVTRSQ